jgi:MFS family permease
MNMKNKLKSNVWKLYAYWFFHNLIFAYVIERLFWQQRGISVQQVVYIEIIYASVIILIEVPTGSLADKWSRKNMMVLSAVFCICEFLILIFAHNFWHFAAAVFIAAISKALSSGTSNALLYDSLKLIGEEKSFEKILGRIRFFDYSAATFAALIGSYAASKEGYVFNYWISLISVFVALIISFTLVEPNIKTSTEEKEFWTYIKTSFKFLKNQTSLKFVLLYGIIIATCLTYVDEFWQLYVKEVNIPVIYFGIISGASFLIVSISGIFAYKIKEKFSYKVIYSFLLVIFTTTLLISSYITSKIGLVFIFLMYSATGLIDPLVSGYLHHRTNSETRATVESFQSLASRIVIIVVGLIFGKLSTNYSVFIGFRFLGFFALLYSVYYLLFQFKYLKE